MLPGVVKGGARRGGGAFARPEKHTPARRIGLKLVFDSPSSAESLDVCSKRPGVSLSRELGHTSEVMGGEADGSGKESAGPCPFEMSLEQVRGFDPVL